MTSGLIWWHSVCREVREDGYRHGLCEADAKDTVFTPDELVAEIARRSTPTPGCGISGKAQEFLRTQWLAAFIRGQYDVTLTTARQS